MSLMGQDRIDACNLHEMISNENPGRAIAHIENRGKSTGIDLIGKCTAAIPRNDSSLRLVARGSEVQDNEHQLLLCPQCVAALTEERDRLRERQYQQEREQQERAKKVEAIKHALISNGDGDLARELDNLV